MALDLYAGPLSRWWAHAWKTEGERAGATTISPDDEPPPSIGVARAIVKEWRAAMNEKLVAHRKGRLTWDESPRAPWFTSRPGWSAYSSLLVFAARDEHPSTLEPLEPVADWSKHRAYRASVRKGFDTRYRQILQPGLWIPGRIDIVFGWVDPTMTKVTIGSVQALETQLADLNARTWKARARQIASWRKAPPRSFEIAARAGFAHLFHLAKQAARHRLPLLLDF